jgi:molybdopterin-guanine dinucleotide biosynthesis protein A
MFDVAGFILVGGASRRMGTDKATLPLGSQTVLEKIASELKAATSSVTLVGARHEYDAVSLLNVPDLHQSWGALGGIHTALSAATTDWIIVLACDLPFVTRRLFERLKTLIDEGVDAIIPVQPDGRPQPVCSLYRRKTCLPEIEVLIADGVHTPRALLAKVRTRYVDFRELSDLSGSENFFLNLNTPVDFERAARLAESGQSP